jgi:hypothetical protein
LQELINSIGGVRVVAPDDLVKLMVANVEPGD